MQIGSLFVGEVYFFQAGNAWQDRRMRTPDVSPKIQPGMRKTQVRSCQELQPRLPWYWRYTSIVVGDEGFGRRDQNIRLTPPHAPGPGQACRTVLYRSVSACGVFPS